MNKIEEKHYMVKVDNAIHHKEYDDAYVLCNAELTGYLTKIKRNTESLLISNPMAGNALLKIDLKALDEIFKKLIYIIYNGNITVNIDDKFKRIENLFGNKKLYELIRFYRVLSIKLLGNNTTKIKELLKDFDYNEIERVELLRLYYETAASDLEYSDRIEIIIKLIEKESNEIEKLRCHILLATNYNVNNERQNSIKVVEQVEETIRNIKIKELEKYELNIMAHILFYSGLILKDNSFFKLSIEVYNQILTKMDEIENISDLYNNIGEVHLMGGDFNKAIEFFKLSLESSFNHLAHINLARAKISLGNITDAANEIYNFNIGSIPEDNLLDYLITIGTILIENKDKDKAKKVYKTLKELNIEEGLFNDYRNNIIINLLEQYKGFYQENKLTGFRGFIEETNKILELKPNFMGLGFNLNHMISKAAKKK